MSGASNSLVHWFAIELAGWLATAAVLGLAAPMNTAAVIAAVPVVLAIWGEVRMAAGRCVDYMCVADLDPWRRRIRTARSIAIYQEYTN